MGLTFKSIELGEIEIEKKLSKKQDDELRAALRKSGLDLLDNRKLILMEKIKNIVAEMVHSTDEMPKVLFSAHISKTLNYDYAYISKMFSEIKGSTLEHYIIVQKIERAKELLLYQDHTLTEIAFKLNYSSVAHLSSQFKKVCGLSPSFFKKIKMSRQVENTTA
jgi:AraC-like DNA-binding protein